MSNGEVVVPFVELGRAGCEGRNQRQVPMQACQVEGQLGLQREIVSWQLNMGI